MTYLVSGCGVSAICGREWLPYWMEEMVKRGGVPSIEPLSELEDA